VEKVESGLLAEKAALQIARRILYTNAMELYGLKPSMSSLKPMLSKSFEHYPEVWRSCHWLASDGRSQSASLTPLLLPGAFRPE
jgi:hypothetical protein